MCFVPAMKDMRYKISDDRSLILQLNPQVLRDLQRQFTIPDTFKKLLPNEVSQNLTSVDIQFHLHVLHLEDQCI